MVDTSPTVTHSIRESLEAFEQQHLSRVAALSSQSKGREIDEPPCPIRTCFQRDRDRILHAKAFRRLKHKTQVFISPTGDHFRTRLTHTLEVAQVSRTIARALGLNEDLTEAIALAHDLGHPPFGHSGEETLNEVFPGGFHHEVQSVRIVRYLEPLNLSFEVLNGMESQYGSQKSVTLEGRLVKLADRMTYLHHDVEDAVRAGIIQETDIPAEITEILGRSRKERLDKLILDLVFTTKAQFQQAEETGSEADIGLSPHIYEAMMALRKFMFKQVYLSATQLSQKQKIRRVLHGLYEYLCDHADLLQGKNPLDPYSLKESTKDVQRQALDYIAGMTDRFAIDSYTRLLLPVPQRVGMERLFVEPDDEGI